MLINKGKGQDLKLKPKNSIVVKEVPSKLKKNLNENLKKPLSKLLETNSNNRPNFSPLDKHFANGLKPVVKSTPLTSFNNIRHGETDANYEKVNKIDNTLRSSDIFGKKIIPKEEKLFAKKSLHKKENSNQNGYQTNNNTLTTGANEKTVINKQIITQVANASPIKMMRQISSLTNNNLTTNYTEMAKDGLTIKTNTIESGELVNTMQSPSNYKTLTNNLKTISSKITPKANQHTLLANNLISYNSSNNNPKNINLFDKAIKIVQYNNEKNNVDLENLNILQSIHQFGQILRNTNLGQNCIFSEDNLGRINKLNEILKSLSNDIKDINAFTLNKPEEKPISNNISVRTVNSNNLANSLKATKNNQKPYFSHTNTNGIKKNLKILNNLTKQPLSPKINTPKDRLLSKENDDCNITDFSEPKMNSANKKDIIISEIYKNSDVRIKRYGVLFEFITTNLSEIKNLIISSTLKKSEIPDIDNDDIIKLNLLNNQDGHMKKKSSTSNEIERMAKKINEDNNKIFSSSSMLNSTLKNHIDSGKIINLSKEIEKEKYSENCNDSDIEEFVDKEEKGEFLQIKHIGNTFDNIVEDKIDYKKKSNHQAVIELLDVTKSFLISSINSEYYRQILDESFIIHNNISLEMSDLKGEVVLNESIEQSVIVEKKIIDASLDKTRENINLFEKKKIVPQNVIKNIEKKFTIPIMKPKLASNHNIPKVEHDKEKINDTEITNNLNNNMNMPVINHESKKEKDTKCILF